MLVVLNKSYDFNKSSLHRRAAVQQQHGRDISRQQEHQLQLQDQQIKQDEDISTLHQQIKGTMHPSVILQYSNTLFML